MVMALRKRMAWRNIMAAFRHRQLASLANGVNNESLMESIGGVFLQ